MAAFITVLASGIGLGCVYGLLALSYNVVYRASGVFSFAQGQLLTLGTLAAYQLTVVRRAPVALGCLVACLAVAAVGVAIERLAVRPVMRSPEPLWVLSTLGAGLLITAVAQRVWGTEPLRVPGYLARDTFRLGGATVSTNYFLPLVALVVLGLALWQLEERTRLGKAIRALALNRNAAVLAGVPVSTYTMIAFGIGGAVAGIAGYLTAPALAADPNSGFSVGVVAFASWAIGGFGSHLGAAVGGLIVGVTERVSGFYLDERLPLIAIFAMLLCVMLARPSGIFGKPSARQV